MVTKEEARKVISLVVDIINQVNTGGLGWDNPNYARDVREIISAIRGPDEDDAYRTKRMTTAVIRKLIGITENSNIDIAFPDDDLTLKNVTLDFQSEGHFSYHIWRAKKALISLGYLSGEEDENQ